MLEICFYFSSRKTKSPVRRAGWALGRKRSQILNVRTARSVQFLSLSQLGLRPTPYPGTLAGRGQLQNGVSVSY